MPSFQFQISETEFKRAVEDVLKELLPRMQPTSVPKLSYRLKDAALATGMSVAWFRQEIRRKRIKTITLGHALLISADEMKRILTAGTNSDEGDEYNPGNTRTEQKKTIVEQQRY